MRKKKAKLSNHVCSDRKIQVFKTFDQTPNKHLAKNDPLNIEEQKFQFLYYGITPKFEFRVSADQLVSLSNKKKGEIHFDLLPEATWILEKVKEQIGSGENYADRLFGPRIGVDRASELLRIYLRENGVEGMMSISWSKDLSCSGRMCWVGPCLKVNKPEARKYSLWLKDSSENHYLRERGILCLADHEIGTHFIRMYNDGLQPWFSNRQKFGLQKLKSASLLQTEEGLASINTLLGGNSKYLFFPALLYYTACKATELTFQELFDHLKRYISDSEQRWRYVMRVKRHLPDPADVGGYGKDQCYFTGAVEVLRNLDKIQFDVLYSGKVTVAELPRVKHTARLDSIKLPHFMKDIKSYTKQLRHIASVNGLLTNKKNKKKKTSARSRSGRVKRGVGRSVSCSLEGEDAEDCEMSLEDQSVGADDFGDVARLKLTHTESSPVEFDIFDDDCDDKSLPCNENSSSEELGDEENVSLETPARDETEAVGIRHCFSDSSLALRSSQAKLTRSEIGLENMTRLGVLDTSYFNSAEQCGSNGKLHDGNVGIAGTSINLSSLTSNYQTVSFRNDPTYQRGHYFESSTRQRTGQGTLPRSKTLEKIDLSQKPPNGSKLSTKTSSKPEIYSQNKLLGDGDDKSKAEASCHPPRLRLSHLTDTLGLQRTVTNFGKIECLTDSCCGHRTKVPSQRFASHICDKNLVQLRENAYFVRDDVWNTLSGNILSKRQKILPNALPKS